MKITVIGSFVMDMVARVREFPKEGQTISGKSLGIFPGGKGINQCVAAARLGAETEMIGMLGRDANGDVFREILKEEKIRSECVFSCDAPTAVGQIQIDDAGENKIVVIPSANYEFGEREIERAEKIIAKSGLVLLQLELRTDIVYKLIDVCAQYKVPVILNPAPAIPLRREVFPKISYITPNETELQILTGMPTGTEKEIFSAADRLLEWGVKYVVATLGKRGALLAGREEKRIIPGFLVEPVDTVAAGDSFNGALARCLALNMPLADAIKFANAVGALTVTKPGAIPSLPRLDEVERFLSCKQ